MTISDQLNYLNGTKQAIAAAINEKGVEVTSSDTFRSYAEKISQITTDKHPVFCFNSGAVDTEGKAAGVTVSNNTLTLHSNSVGTTAKGKTYTVKSNVTKDVSSLANGTYNLYYEPSTNKIEVYENTIFIDEARPESMHENDIWLDTSVMPYVSKMVNASDELTEVDLIPLPATIEVGGGVNTNT